MTLQVVCSSTPMGEVLVGALAECLGLSLHSGVLPNVLGGEFQYLAC